MFLSLSLGEAGAGLVNFVFKKGVLEGKGVIREGGRGNISDGKWLYLILTLI